jgi:O-antigen/teichoic acid export membrane protein
MTDDLTKVAQDSARGGFFLVSGTALSTGILAIASILIARFLGPELYGQYALALVVPQLLFFFTDLGITQGITKFTADLQSKGETNRILNIIKHGLLIRALIGIAIFAINYSFAGVIASSLLQRPDLAFYIQLASTYVLFQVVFTTATSAFVGLDKTEYQAITTNIQAMAKTIVSLVLVLAGLSITGAIIGYTVSYIVAAATAIPLLWLILRKRKSGEGDNLRTNLKTLFQYGTPLYVSVLLTGFLPLLINVVLAFFTTDADIGNYKAAINFATLLTVLAIPITTILLPAFSKLNSTTNQKIRDFFKIAVKYTTLIVIPVTFLIIIFSEEIVQIIYGGTYESASIFLSTYCLLYFSVGVGYLTLPSLFNGLSETRITLKMSLITFIALILLSVPLTQSYDVQGVIVAFLIANTVGTLYGAYKAKRKFQIEYDTRNILKVYLISAMSGVAPLLLSNLVNLNSILNLALGGVLYLLTYVTLMPLTNLVTRSELQRIGLATQNTPVLKQIAKLLLNYQERIMRLKTIPENQYTLKT